LDAFCAKRVSTFAHARRLPDQQERDLLDANTIVIGMIKHALDGL
jgi:hypothetical protein